MKILVLGGSGFIGRRLVDALLERGHRVGILTRGRRPAPWGGRITKVQGDRRNRSDLARAAHAGRDAVIDLLSYGPGDASLAVEAFSGKTDHFIHISTCSVYWCTGRFGCPAAEDEFESFGDFEEHPDSIEYEYGYGKRKAEEVLFRAHRECGFPVTAIRMPIVGGEMDPTGRYFTYFHRIADGRPILLPDSGANLFRHVYVGDVASALAALPGSAGALGRAYNLACEEIVDLGSVLRLAAGFMSRGLKVVPVPRQFLEEEGLDRSFSPFTQPASQVPSIRRARAELNWQPTPYSEWLERTVTWYLDCYRAGDPPGYEHRARELELVERYLGRPELSAPGTDS